MKTPREVILERHQAAEARLAALRAEDLAAEARGEGRLTVRLAGAAQRFWLEAIWPWRRVWAGVGAGWAVIFVMYFAAADAPETAAAHPSRPSPEAQAVLQQQEQLLTQLLGVEALPTPAHPKAAGPRSEAEPASGLAAAVGTPRRGVRFGPAEDFSAKRPYLPMA
jgi:hypothetical protein